MSSTMSHPPLLEQIQEEYGRIATLWDRFTETSAIKGLDSNVVQETRQYVATARDSLKTAQEVMEQSIKT